MARLDEVTMIHALLAVLCAAAVSAAEREPRFAYTTAVPVSFVIADEAGKTIYSFAEGVRNIHWSPDGKNLLFKDDIWHPDEGEMDGLFLLPAGSSNAVQTGIFGYITQASWSHDGRSIILDEGLEIYSVSTDAVKYDKLCGKERQPRIDWVRASPDGKRFLGVAREDYRSSESLNLYLSGPACESITRLTNETAYLSNYAWAPDSKRIAYIKEGVIVVLGADGKRRQEIKEAGRYFALDWTDDGRLLASWDDGLKTEGLNKIGIIDPAGGKTVVLLEHADPPATVLTWRPRKR